MAGAGELSSRENCVRWLFVICNILILLCGLAALGIGIWLIIIEDRIEEILSENYTAGGAMSIAAGALTIFIALLGMIGAIKKYKYALLLYAVTILLVVVLEVMTVGYAIAKADDIDEDQIMEDLQNALDRYYSSNDTENYDEDLNDVVDFIQENLECCGINNTNDWIGTPYYEENGRLPSSCCGRNEPEACPKNEVYNKGCQQVLTDAIQDNLYILVGVAIAFAVFEVVMILMSFYLFMAINNSVFRYHKA